MNGESRNTTGGFRTPTISIIKRVNIPFLFLLPLAQFGCIPMPAGGASDVPCLEPTAWPNGSTRLLTRQDGENLLITSQTSEQRSEDFDDGDLGDGEHGPTYRLDNSTNEFELLDDGSWENALGEVTACIGSGGGVLFGSYVVDGQQIPLQGRGVRVSGFGGVVGILSADGSVPIQFISSASTGQHYSQFFSAEDHSPLTEPVRVGVGGTDVSTCWTVDGRFLIYFQRVSLPEREIRFDVLCFVENTTEVTIETEEVSP